MATIPTDLEQQVLLTVWRLDGDAYGLRVRDELEETTGKRMTVGATYATLIRLERKGWVVSRLADPTPVRGGKRKRLFEITEAGSAALEQAREVMAKLWSSLDSGREETAR